MPLETGTYISDLVTSNPVGTDTIDKADDHLRLIKSTVKNTFPNISGAVTPTHTDLNKLTSTGSPQFSTIELGNASDTTLSRSAAGVLSVEGVAVPLNSVTNTHIAQQIELGNASDTTITRSAAGVIAVEGGVVPKENRANTFTQTQTVQRNDSSAVLAVTGDGQHSRIESNYYGTTDVAAFVFSRYRGSLASPTAVTTDSDDFGYVDFRGYDGTAVRTGARILGEVDGTPGANDMPGRLVFLTTPNGSTTVTERMRIDADGNVLVTGSGGLGYGTGSGGTVTQATSKATSFTLNKYAGQITLNGAALAANTQVSCTWVNSVLKATDVVVTVITSGVSDHNNYDIRINPAAGAATFSITNRSPNSLSEAVVFNFVVIKSATS